VGGYRVLREIETDSLGSVYEAEHRGLQRRVAVRTIGANVARDVSFQGGSSSSSARTSHSSTRRSKLYELAYEEDEPYLVTEMVAGRTLDEVFEAGERYEPLGVVALLRPIASALDYAHSRRPFIAMSSRRTSSWR